MHEEQPAQQFEIADEYVVVKLLDWCRAFSGDELDPDVSPLQHQVIIVAITDGQGIKLEFILGKARNESLLSG